MFDVIVWATDGSANADLALDYVKKLAEGGQSRVAVHVKEFVVGRAPGPVHLDADQLEQKIQGQVNDLKQAGIDASLQTHPAPAGNAAHITADCAKEAGAEPLPRTVTSPLRQSMSPSLSLATSPPRSPSRAKMSRIAWSRRPTTVARSHEPSSRATTAPSSPRGSDASRQPATPGTAPTNPAGVCPHMLRAMRTAVRQVRCAANVPVIDIDPACRAVGVEDTAEPFTRKDLKVWVGQQSVSFAGRAQCVARELVRDHAKRAGAGRAFRQVFPTRALSRPGYILR